LCKNFNIALAKILGIFWQVAFSNGLKVYTFQKKW
jgi:hypothetical protein